MSKITRRQQLGASPSLFVILWVLARNQNMFDIYFEMGNGKPGNAQVLNKWQFEHGNNYSVFSNVVLITSASFLVRPSIDLGRRRRSSLLPREDKEEKTGSAVHSLLGRPRGHWFPTASQPASFQRFDLVFPRREKGKQVEEDQGTSCEVTRPRVAPHDSNYFEFHLFAFLKCCNFVLRLRK